VSALSQLSRASATIRPAPLRLSNLLTELGLDVTCCDARASAPPTDHLTLHCCWIRLDVRRLRGACQRGKSGCAATCRRCGSLQNAAGRLRTGSRARSRRRFPRRRCRCPHYGRDSIPPNCFPDSLPSCLPNSRSVGGCGRRAPWSLLRWQICRSARQQEPGG